MQLPKGMGRSVVAGKNVTNREGILCHVGASQQSHRKWVRKISSCDFGNLGGAFHCTNNKTTTVVSPLVSSCNDGPNCHVSKEMNCSQIGATSQTMVFFQRMYSLQDLSKSDLTQKGIHSSVHSLIHSVQQVSQTTIEPVSHAQNEYLSHIWSVECTHFGNNFFSYSEAFFRLPASKSYGAFGPFGNTSDPDGASDVCETHSF